MWCRYFCSDSYSLHVPRHEVPVACNGRSSAIVNNVLSLMCEGVMRRTRRASGDVEKFLLIFLLRNEFDFISLMQVTWREQCVKTDSIQEYDNF